MILRGLTAALAKRALQAVVVAVAVATIAFFALLSLPGDQAMRIAAGRYGYDIADTAAAALVRAELGLDRPLVERYLLWLADLARGDLGRSFVSGERVVGELAHLFRHTLVLAVTAFLVGCLVGLPLGWLAGLSPGGLVDRASLAAAVLARALPGFALGILLILLFSVGLGVLPAAGYGSVDALVLPALTVGVGLGGAISRVARDSTVAATTAPFFAFARLKGLSALQALLRHGVRNAAVPVIAYLGVQLAQLIEGVVIAETLFAWPGLGHAMVHAIVARDVPMVQGTALVLGLMFVALNGAVDAASLAADPRRRAAA